MKNLLNTFIVKPLADIFKCHVCSRVTITAFLAIIFVELVVLVPSCQKFINDWQNNKRIQIQSSLKTIISLNNDLASNYQKLSNLITLIAKEENIVGWTIVDPPNLKTAIKFGDSPADDKIASPYRLDNLFSQLDYFNITFDKNDLDTPYEIQLKIASQGLDAAVIGYIIRIAWLVVIISLFVTIAVMVSLQKVIFSPILTLRDHLNAAKNNLQNADQYLINKKITGEIGELYSGFNSLLLYIVEDFKTIANANTKLQNEITERNLVERELRKNKRILSELANYDELTGLPNRRFALDKLEKEIDYSKKSSITGALLFVDLDNFKEINDTLGHASGDELLRQAAERMIAAVRYSREHVNNISPDYMSSNHQGYQHRENNDLVARIGGDEFMIILSNISESQVEAIADRIQKYCTKPFLLDNSEAFSTTSIGITLFPQDSKTVSECMSLSDIALYHSKEIGRNCYSLFSPDMLKGNSQRQKISQHLYSALENDEFDLHFQPIIDLESKKVVSVEALLRWDNVELGFVPPDQFIALAESTALIIPIGEWVLKNAFKRCAELNHSGNALRMAINVSPKQFRSNQFVKVIKTLLEENNLAPELIELEITENLLIEEQSDAAKNISALSQLGIRISIDDFGRGYSSLSYLSRFPVSTLKIDRSFVNGILESRGNFPLVHTIIDMGKNFKLEIVAEGVETEEQVDFLVKHGCDLAQGYYFSKPVVFGELFQKLETNNDVSVCWLQNSVDNNVQISKAR